MKAGKWNMSTTTRPNVMERRLKLAQTLARKNGGKLPNPWKMIQQGHGGLYRYIQRHPKEFKQFKTEEALWKERTKSGRSSFNVSIREEHLKTARNLVQNGENIQDNGWLMQHGYTRLASYIKTYPHVFDDI